MAVFPLLLGAGARAGADVWIYAFLPIYLHVHLHEPRLWVVTLALTVPAVVRWALAPVWGRAADRSARPQRLLIVGLLGYCGLLLGLTHFTQPLALIVLLACTTTLASAFNPVARALVSMHDSNRSLLNLAAWHQWEAAGYLLSGLTLGAAMDDPATFARLTTGTALVLALCALWIASQRHDVRRSEASPHDKTRRSAGAATKSETETRVTRSAPATPKPKTRDAIRTRPRVPRPAIFQVSSPLRWALLFLFIASFIWEAVAGVFGLYFTQIISGSLKTYGFVISASTALSLLIYKPLARYGHNTPTARLFGLTAVSATVMYALMVVRAPWSAAVSYMVPFNTIARTAFNALLVNNVAANRRGEFLGIMEATESSAAVFGPLAGGAGADHFGLGAVPLFALWASFSLHFVVTQPTVRRIV